MNVELAYRALNTAKANRDRFDMSVWMAAAASLEDDAPWDETVYEAVAIVTEDRVPPCGTVGCYAGFVALATTPLGTVVGDGGGLYTPEAWLKYDPTVNYPGDGAFAHTWKWATEQLGITASQADALFHLRSIEQVEKAIGFLAENPDATAYAIREAAGYEPNDDDEF